MTYVFSSVACCEEHGSADESIKTNLVEASVVLRCAWANRYALALDLLTTPRKWPYNEVAVAVQITSIKGDGAQGIYTEGSQGIDWQDALLSVKYSSDWQNSIKEDETSGQLYSDSIEPAVEFQTIDYTRFRWGSNTGDPLKESEAPGKQLHSISFTRTLYKMSAVPTSLLSFQGKVNSASFTSSVLGLTFNAETLLFMPATSSKTVTTSGDPGWDIVCRWMYKPEGWNKFWRAKTQSWESLYIADGNEYKNYPPVDMSALLF